MRISTLNVYNTTTSSCDGTQFLNTAKQWVKPLPALHAVILARLTSIIKYAYSNICIIYIYICYFTQIENNMSLTFGDVSLQKGRRWASHFFNPRRASTISWIFHAMNLQDPDRNVQSTFRNSISILQY